MALSRISHHIDLIIYANISPAHIDEFYAKTPESMRTEDNILNMIEMFNVTVSNE